MKVLQAMHNIIDPGGIVNHTYQLQAGLQDIGHTVETAIFTNTNDKVVRCQLELDQKKLPKDVVIGYKSSVETAINYMKQFDYIIWQVPIPTQSAINKGNSNWPDLYSHGVPQVGIVHDDHITDRTPYINHILDKFVALVAVQTCGHYSAKPLSIPSGIIVNPFDLTEATPAAYKDREKAFASICIWKPKKKMQDIVSAIPYVGNDVRKIIGGGGIEQCYMSSKDKCKDKYIINGERIWDKALANGMEYLGIVQNEDRIKIYSKVMAVVDASYIGNWREKGRSLVRTFMESIISGAVPVARKEFVDPVFFQENKHYIPLPFYASPKAIGEIIHSAVNITENEYNTFQKENKKAILQFDRKVVAQRYIDVLTGKIKFESGKTTQDVLKRSSEILTDFFNIKVKRTGGLNSFFNKR